MTYSLPDTHVIRADVLRAIRAFFDNRGFIEVVTPVRIPVPALELNIDPEPSGDWYLRTSPEFHMKRLVCAGHEKIYQIGSCFRQGEKGCLHNPEFTMLEWYRTGADYIDIIVDVKTLIAFVADEVFGRTWLESARGRLDLLPIWDLVRVKDAFLLNAGWDPVLAFDEDRFDLDLVTRVEPALPIDRPVLLIDFPAELAAMARLKKDRPEIAERWELYIAGVELANAFSELTDYDEQKERFERWSRKRQEAGKDVFSFDEPFLDALKGGMPPCAGVALGVDRLIMLLAGRDSIEFGV